MYRYLVLSILVPLVLIVSRPLLLLLFSVALLAAAVRKQSDGERLGVIAPATRFELRAGITSLEDDLEALRLQMSLAPVRLRDLWNDAMADAESIKAEVAQDAQTAARRISTLIRTN